MDTFFVGLFHLLLAVLVLLLFAVVLSYLYERGIGRPVFDALIKDPKWKKAQFLLVLVFAAAITHYLNLDVVGLLNGLSPMLTSPSPDVSNLVSAVVVAILSSWLHEKTSLNTP